MKFFLRLVFLRFFHPLLSDKGKITAIFRCVLRGRRNSNIQNIDSVDQGGETRARHSAAKQWNTSAWRSLPKLDPQYLKMPPEHAGGGGGAACLRPVPNVLNWRNRKCEKDCYQFFYPWS